MANPIGNSCGCGHKRRYHRLYVGGCFAVHDGYECGCAGYVRNYLVVMGLRPWPDKKL